MKKLLLFSLIVLVTITFNAFTWVCLKKDSPHKGRIVVCRLLTYSECNSLRDKLTNLGYQGLICEDHGCEGGGPAGTATCTLDGAKSRIKEIEEL